MCTTQMIQGISGAAIAIGGICLAMSGGKLWGRKINWKIGAGFAGIGVGLFMLVTSFPEYAIGFSVLATLALAYAAFLTIQEANAREKRRIEEERLKVNRDQVRIWLSISQNWATSIVDILDKDIAYYFASPKRLKILIDMFMIPSTDKTSILAISEKTPDAELAKRLKKAVTSFDHLIASLLNVISSEVRKLVEKRKLAEKQIEECRSSMFLVIQRVKEIKTLLLLE